MSRLIAATTLVISGAAVATVVSTVPAGAVNGALTFNCGTGYSSAAVANGATVTVTVGTSCTSFTFGGINGAAPQGSATLNGSYVPPSQPISVVQGNTIVFTAPASGSGEDALTFVAGQNPGDGVVISYPAPTGSVVDNGDGTVNVSYTGGVVLFLYPSGTVCPPELMSPGRFIYFLDSSQGSPSPLPVSPFVISSSTIMYHGARGLEPVAAGSYQACMFELMGAADLVSSTAVSIGQAAPTTTTAGPDPVAPAFTG